MRLSWFSLVYETKSKSEKFLKDMDMSFRHRNIMIIMWIVQIMRLLCIS